MMEGRLAAATRYWHRIDPGFLNLSRSIHIGTATIVSGLIAYWIYLIGGVSAGVPNLAIFAASAGAHILMFTTPGSRKSEWPSIAGNSALVAAIYLSALIGWGTLDPSGGAVSLAWIFVIGIGFYLRRYGVRGTQIGMLLSIMFMFIVIENPTRETSIWLPLAAVIGSVVAAAIRLGTWRPSALIAFSRLEEAILRELSLRLSDADHHLSVPLRIDDLRLHWMALAKISKRAARENNEQADAIRSRVLKVLRVLLAAEYLAELETEIVASGKSALLSHPDFEQVRSEIAGALTELPWDGTWQSHALEGLRNRILDLEADEMQKGSWWDLRLFAAYSRMFDIIVSRDFSASDVSAPETPAVQNAQNLKHAATHMAIQALFAAGLATFLSRALSLPNYYWTTLTVLVVLSGTAGATVTRIVQRSLGTALGAALAIVTQGLFDSPTFQIVSAIMALTAVFIVLESNYLIAAACIGYAVLTALHLLLGVDTAHEFARIYDTALGAAIGMFTAVFVFPLRSTDHVADQIETLLQRTHALILHTSAPPARRNACLDALETSARSLAETIPDIEAERLLKFQPPKFLRRRLAYADALVCYASLYTETLQRAETLDLPGEAVEFIDSVKRDLEQSFDKSSEPSTSENSRIRDIPLPDRQSITGRTAMLLIGIRYYAFKTADILRILKGMRA